MRCYRRVLKIKWNNKDNNSEILNKINISRKIWKAMIVHNFRYPETVLLILKGIIEGKNWVRKSR